MLIAGHDVPAALRYLGCRDSDAVKEHLHRCRPSPLTLPDEQFTDHFRQPGTCLIQLISAAGGQAPQKNSSLRGDALDEISKSSITRLCARVPDLAALALLVQSLA